MVSQRSSGCAFCGASGSLTREHLVPEWLSKLIAVRFAGDEPMEVSYRFTDTSGQLTDRSYRARRTQIVVRRVCQACNGGWMSRLESGVRPVMSLLVTGARTRIDLDQQALLAHWVAKTVVMLEQFEARAVVFDASDVAQVYRGHAPIGFHMRLGYRPVFAEQVDILASTAHVIPVHEANAALAAGRGHRVGAANNFLITLALGGLAIGIAGGPGIRRDDRWITGGEQPLMIWPPTLEGIRWPPESPRISSKTELKEFHEAIYARGKTSDLAARLLAASGEPSSEE